jgi:hypothetical protein
MTDLEAIRKAHYIYARDPALSPLPDDPQWCAYCDRPWPCHTRIVLDALDRAKAIRCEDWEITLVST